MTRPLFGIVAALPEELRPLRARLLDERSLRSESTGGRVVWCGRLGRSDVALMATGDGERNARTGVAALFDTVAVDALIVIGTAGALSPRLGVADLVFATEVRDGGGAVWRPPNDVLAAARDLVTRASLRAGRVVTVKAIVDSTATKQMLAERHQDAAWAVVDLETAHYAAAAEARRIPWAALRAVSDTANESLPALLNRCRDEGGAIRRMHVVRSMLFDPRPLPWLLELRGRVRVSAERLADGVARLCAVWPSPDVDLGKRGRARRSKRETHAVGADGGTS